MQVDIEIDHEEVREIVHSVIAEEADVIKRILDKIDRIVAEHSKMVSNMKLNEDFILRVEKAYEKMQMVMSNADKIPADRVIDRVMRNKIDRLERELIVLGSRLGR